MEYAAKTILDRLLSATPRLTSTMPRDSRGIYGLVDHTGILCYIGSTSSADETFYKRIHQRHRTGSESASHYFSRMYNTGRMWRDRADKMTVHDGSIAKELRNAFIADHCRAVCVALPDDLDIAGLEHAVLALAPADAIAWNRRATEIYGEPCELVDATLERLRWGKEKLEAIERQRLRHLSGNIISSPCVPTMWPTTINPFPAGPFRFFALDVETANSNRASICQIGVACVREDSSIETWVTYIDPKTNDWSNTKIHGITARTVSGAPSFDKVFPDLQKGLGASVVYQHSSFDQSAIAAACQHGRLTQPTWEWRDSVRVARAAWPELKGNGGHGLSSLKQHLGLEFTHHDAGEDARACAQVVLRAERQGMTMNVAIFSVRATVAEFHRSAPGVIVVEDAPGSECPELYTEPTQAQVSGSHSTLITPNSTNPTRDAMLARIEACPDVCPHESQRDAKGTKYLSAFTVGGVTFVIDKMSKGKQPIWVHDRADLRAYLDAERMSYDVYTPSMGRNSNLHKLANFKTGQLLRIYPTTVEQGVAVIAKLG